MKLKRISYLDSLKTILIFLVVLGHCLIRLGGGNSLIKTVLILIYSVHMPLFIFVSGYFSRPEKSARESSLSVFAAFVLFQLIWTFITPPHSINKILSPATTLWYLLSLCYWRLLIKLFNTIWKNKTVWLVVSVVLMIVAGFVPLSTEFSFQRTFAFFPFFVMGNMMRNTELLQRIRSKNMTLRICVAAAIIICAIAIYSTQPNVMWLLYGKFPFQSYHTSMMMAPILKIGWLVIATMFCLLILTIIPDVEFLSKEGGKTLTVYLFHFFPIYFLQKMGFQSNSIILLLIIACGIYCLTSFIHKFKIVRWMVSPLKYTNK